MMVVRFVCPQTKQALSPLSAAQLRLLNVQIRKKKVHNQAGKCLAKPLSAAFVRADQLVAYPIEGHIPILLASHAIPLDQVTLKSLR